MHHRCWQQIQLLKHLLHNVKQCRVQQLKNCLCVYHKHRQEPALYLYYNPKYQETRNARCLQSHQCPVRQQQLQMQGCLRHGHKHHGPIIVHCCLSLQGRHCKKRQQYSVCNGRIPSEYQGRRLNNLNCPILLVELRRCFRLLLLPKRRVHQLAY